MPQGVGVQVPMPAPKCVDERCNAENAAQKRGVFTYNAPLLERKSCKNSIFQNFSFAQREATFQRCSRLFLWTGVTRTPRLKRIKNKKTGRRSAPYVGADGGLFRLIGAYVAFASFVYHSLVVLVIAFTGPFGYACVTKNEEVSENGNH